MSQVRGIVLLVATSLLTACAVGPDYKKPEVDMPSVWQGGVLFHEGTPNDVSVKGDWWDLFGDAQLNQLEQQVLKQNESLKVATERLMQARAQVTVASAGLFPQLGLQAGVARQKISADRPMLSYNTPNRSTVQNNDQLGFAVNYEVDLFGGVRRTAENARAAAEQAAADFENTRLILMSELAADYFNLREIDAELDVVRQGLVLQEKALGLITSRHDLGIASDLDLAQQRALLDANRTQLELLLNQRMQYLHALATMSGVPAPSFNLEPAVLTLSPPQIPVGLPSDVLQRRPDIAAAERAMAAANASIGVARAAYFPNILLQPIGGWDSNQMGALFDAPSVLWSLGVGVSQAVFDAGKTQATVSITESSYNASVANYRQSVLIAMQEVEDGISGMTLLENASVQAQASVKSSQRVLDLANSRYSGGLDTYLDVITAQQSLLSNQRQEVQIRGKQMVTSVYLIKALGGGWSGNLKQVVTASTR